MKVDGIIMSLKARSFSPFALHPASSAITPPPRISETTILPSPLIYYTYTPVPSIFLFWFPRASFFPSTYSVSMCVVFSSADYPITSMFE
jgi:hypothetical protein